MKLLSFIILFITSCPVIALSQMMDCNKDRNCVKMVLIQGRPETGWKFVQEKAINWDDKPCPDSTDYYFFFRDNDSLYIYKKTKNCQGQVLKTRFIYCTTYHVTEYSYGQFGVRIFMFKPNIGRCLKEVERGIKLKEKFSDFQFVNSGIKSMILRSSGSLSEAGSIENEFK